ncbi:hypothetical protein A3A14_02250 [Candidatus Daviesbacteria bacterium RIFCSPLOWO2_01_FULL_43_38]|uniref:Uncharacterized protein n=1 Tax=Candidatus Daviesbacteria bacterium RIFCSPHIGHO2_12_FULL_43_11 TaxID=1797780 RepID=A0A1F5K7A6_9BACT|nr:MAG: hypothetical protein A2874_04135 [Candidatus Daviesbacteria bacterium RIFCSPHIGHO2_01_FULL_43_17]OGE36827.1 MAG: hypothetical protein A3E45_05125 [Candidatus Daviesbacteria bacterium RIFCSPHIGHO2_12_FULL_43_11]OGE63858.1 MAG: hypothetical protein A3A14_02250 [Candidatus Daviesbacteria bacterium RIFCSPLOWO2_01_FULL_43_38]
MEPVDDQENTQPTTENDNSDPKEYINRYLNSPDVKEKVEKRYQVARLIDPEVTKEDAYEAFLGTDEAKEALWVFYKNNRFIFNEQKLSPKVNFKLSQYLAKIESIKEKESLRRYDDNLDERIDDDRGRYAKHNKAAQQLVDEGIVPNTTLGRLMVHFMAISLGVDAPDPERDTRRRRLVAVVG